MFKIIELQNGYTYENGFLSFRSANRFFIKNNLSLNDYRIIEEEK